MPEAVTPEHVRHFAEHGFVRGFDVLDPTSAARHMAWLEELEQVHRLRRPKDKWFGLTGDHPLRDWVTKVAGHPEVLAAGRALLGDKAVIRNVDVFDKPTRFGVLHTQRWHRDCAFDDPEGKRLVTAWVALVDATPMSGCLRFIPGSHLVPSRDDGFRMRWMLRGHRVVQNCLPAGAMSLHHGHLIHRSRGNYSNVRRVAFAIRFHVPAPDQWPAPEFFQWH